MKFAVRKRNMTPDHPVFLAGFGARTKKSEGVLDELYVKTVLLRNHRDLLVIALDALGCDRGFTDGIKTHLGERFGLLPEQILIQFSHTHASVYLTGEHPELRRGNYSMGQEGWSDDPDAIDYTEDIQYYRKLRDAIAEMTAQCMDDLQDGELSIGFGKSMAAVNRRLVTDRGVRMAPNGEAEIDRDLTVLSIHNREGELRAILFSIACHPTAMGPGNNKISAEFVGRACRRLEEAHPGAVAFFLQGCAADLKPAKSAEGGSFTALSPEQMYAAGDELADETERVIRAAAFQPVSGPFDTALTEVLLDIEAMELTDIERWARSQGAYYERAVSRLQRLAEQGKIKTSYSLAIQAWQLSDNVRLIALESEIPTGYSLRLKTLFPDQKLIVLGYSNSVYTYIPTETILEQGGYEADHPLTAGFAGRFAKGTEEKIIRAADRLCSSLGKS